jgi:outer membrane protein TolC
MQSHLFKPIYSTTLIAAILAGATPVLAASADADAAAVVAAAPAEISELTLDQAIEKAITSNIDLRLLKLDCDSAYYTTRLTLLGTKETKIDSITSLNSAKAKFETEADAIRDYKVAESSWKIQENIVRLNVHKAYFDVLAAKEKVDLQKKYVKIKDWAKNANKDAHETLRELEAKYREALAKLNQLMNEKSDKDWNLTAESYSTFQLLPIDEYKKTAYERRPDLVKASAEKAFAQANVNYISQYASLSTYPGRIAQIDLKKAELLWQMAQRKADQEIEANYEKVIQAKQAMEESSVSQKSAEERYRQTYIDYLNGKASASELADREEKWLDSTAESIDSAYQYNVAVATLQYSIGF